MYDFTEESIKNFYKETEEIMDNLYNEVVEENKKLVAMHKDMIETSLTFGRDTQIIAELVANFEGDNNYAKSCLLRSNITKLIHRMNTITAKLSNKSNFPFWIRHKRGKIYNQAMDLRRILCNIKTELYANTYKINKLSENEYKYYFEFLENIMQIKYDIEFSLFAEKEEYIITLYKAEAYFRKIELKNIIENLKKLNKILK